MCKIETAGDMAFDKEMAKNGDTPAEPAHRIVAVGGKTHEQICREIQERVNLLEVQEKVRKAAEKAKEEAVRENEKKVEKHLAKRAAKREKMAELLPPTPMPLPKPAPPLHARNASAAIGGKAYEQIRLEIQEKVKKAAAADMVLEALDSSEHIKATTFHNERYRH
jgi:hypothetical protein